MHFLINLFLSNLPFFATLAAVILVCFFLESRIPAVSGQKILHNGVWEDMLWLVFLKVFRITLLLWYISFLSGLYHKYLDFLTVKPLAELPFWFRFVSGFVLNDFLGWFSHLIRHKVPWFWHFHAIHHSQRKMNLFSDFRVHFGDYLIADTIKILPLLILDFNHPQIIAITMVHMFLTRMHHANIRTNFGPFKYILVTPQSHRIHHSSELKHYDKNFGVIFSVWDYLFGTQYKGYDEYPVTGLNGDERVLETPDRFRAIFKSFLFQVYYPFSKIMLRKHPKT